MDWEELYKKLKLRGSGDKNIPITPTTLRWENMLNKVLLDKIMSKSGTQYKDTYLLGKDYFNPVFEERNYPYPPEKGFDFSNISGFAPHKEFYSSFGGGNRLQGLLNNAIVLNKDSNAPKEIMPWIFRHETSHVRDKPFSGERNYGYILPKKIQGFLSGYEPKGRGNELRAELFAGRKMPEQLKNILLQKMSEEIGY